MTRPNPSTALAEVVIDEMARNGVEMVVISPGSRSAALAIAAAGHPQVDTVVVIDERSAAFWALGRAKATGTPAAVVSTSGTAPANWYPAVVEADMSLTPLVLVSADRPSELRGVGANQAIDQVGMFGARVRRFCDIPAPEGEDGNDRWRSTVCAALSASRGDTALPGPVHLNVAFREPTVPVSDDGRTRWEPFIHPVEGRSDGLPWHDPPRGTPTAAALPDISTTSRGLIIVGAGDYDRDRLMAAAHLLGWPVLATALSGLRGGDVVDSYHHLLAGGVPRALSPDLVLAVGAIGPSDRLEGLFGSAGQRIRAHPRGRPIDPGGNATVRFDGDPVALLESIQPLQDRDWVDRWRLAATTARDGMAAFLADSTTNSGARIAAELDRVDWSCLVVGSSLPIREVDAHLTRSGMVVANRGASGVDGFVSTALGVSTAMPGTVAFSGDLGLFHDSNGYLGEEVSDLVVVVADNGGGGLFDSLPLARHAPFYERLFVTPHRRRIADLAALHGLTHRSVAQPERLGAAVAEAMATGGRTIVEVPVDRATDLETRHRLDEIGRSAVEVVES